MWYSAVAHFFVVVANVEEGEPLCKRRRAMVQQGVGEVRPMSKIMLLPPVVCSFFSA